MLAVIAKSGRTTTALLPDLKHAFGLQGDAVVLNVAGRSKQDIKAISRLTVDRDGA